jgi:Trp operon repressor
MTYKEQLKEWKNRREEIYKEVMKGKKSQRKIATEYGLSNERIRQIVKQEEKSMEK